MPRLSCHAGTRRNRERTQHTHRAPRDAVIVERLAAEIEALGGSARGNVLLGLTHPATAHGLGVICFHFFVRQAQRGERLSGGEHRARWRARQNFGLLNFFAVRPTGTDAFTDAWVAPFGGLS